MGYQRSNLEPCIHVVKQLYIFIVLPSYKRTNVAQNIYKTYRSRISKDSNFLICNHKSSQCQNKSISNIKKGDINVKCISITLNQYDVVMSF